MEFIKATAFFVGWGHDPTDELIISEMFWKIENWQIFKFSIASNDNTFSGGVMTPPYDTISGGSQNRNLGEGQNAQKGMQKTVRTYHCQEFDHMVKCLYPGGLRLLHNNRRQFTKIKEDKTVGLTVRQCGDLS